MNTNRSVKRKAGDAAYRAANPSKVKASKAAWRAANPGYSAAYRAANHDKLTTLAAAYYAANRDEFKARGVLYRATRVGPNPTKQWRVDHPEQYKALNKVAKHKRRALLVKATVEPFTPSELVAHIKELGGRCVYCDGPYERLDHVYPLSKGGPHTLSNLVPCCQPCNNKKGAKLPLQWLVRDGVAV